MQEEFANAVVCMLGSFTELDKGDWTNIAIFSSHDVHSLLCNFMDEFFFQFATNGFVTKPLSPFTLPPALRLRSAQLAMASAST